jgi:hypothetical protein
VPFGAHGGESGCVDNLMRTFIAKGAVKGLDTSCVAKLPMTPFEIAAPKPAPAG